MRQLTIIAMFLSLAAATLSAQPQRQGRDPEHSPRDGARERARRQADSDAPDRLHAMLKQRLDAVRSEQEALNREEARLVALIERHEKGERIGPAELARLSAMRAQRGSFPMRGDRPQRPDASGPISGAEAAQMLEQVRKIHEPSADGLESVRLTDEAAFLRLMRRLEPRLAEIAMLREEGDTARAGIVEAELHAALSFIHAMRVLAEARASEDEAMISRATEDLRRAIGLGFDARLLGARQEISRLESRLSSLRGDLDARMATRDRFIAESLRRSLRTPGQAQPGDDEAPADQPPGRRGP